MSDLAKALLETWFIYMNSKYGSQPSSHTRSLCSRTFLDQLLRIMVLPTAGNVPAMVLSAANQLPVFGYGSTSGNGNSGESYQGEIAASKTQSDGKAL